MRTNPCPTRVSAVEGASLRPHREQGFSLIEMMVCIAILAVAVFPLLLIKEESQLAATDAKFRRIARNSIQDILSKAMIELRPGDTMRGDLADQGYPNIQYEVECEALDLSTEIGSAEEDKKAGDSLFKDAEQEKKDAKEKEKRERGLLDDPEAGIDERFLARHVKVTISYMLGTGENSDKGEIKTETYLNPLPKKKDILADTSNGAKDKVAPNTGGSGSGSKSGGTQGKGGTGGGKSGSGGKTGTGGGTTKKK